MYVYMFCIYEIVLFSCETMYSCIHSNAHTIYILHLVLNVYVQSAYKPIIHICTINYTNTRIYICTLTILVHYIHYIPLIILIYTFPLYTNTLTIFIHYIHMCIYLLPLYSNYTYHCIPTFVYHTTLLYTYTYNTYIYSSYSFSYTLCIQVYEEHPAAK